MHTVKGKFLWVPTEEQAEKLSTLRHFQLPVLSYLPKESKRNEVSLHTTGKEGKVLNCPYWAQVLPLYHRHISIFPEYWTSFKSQLQNIFF